MAQQTVAYQVGDKSFEGVLVYEEAPGARRPLLLMSPNWMGVSDGAVARTRRVIGRKYVGFVVDMYGAGIRPSGPQEAGPLADGVRADVPERRRRIGTAFDAFVATANQLGIGDSAKTGAVGFCFGGGNVLELARSGADVSATVCLHGEFITPFPAKAGDIRGTILVAHGSADPVAPKAQRDSFEAEMDAAGVDWRMITFGGRFHSFCEEEAKVPGVAMYDEGAARETYALIESFLEKAFA